MVATASTFLGPALIGVILNALLHGVMGLQCCHYYNYSATNDPRWMKILIGLLLLIETINTTFDIAWIYDALIHQFMNPMAVTKANWIFATDPAMVGIIATIVQMFFAWRVQVLTRNPWVVWFIRATSLGSIFGGIGTAIAIHFVSDFLQFHKFRAIMIVWLASAVICDTTIAVALSSHLLRHKTGIASTDKLINRVTIMTISNALLVTIVAIANLIAFVASPTGLYLVFNFPLAKLYSNSLISTLNKRPTSRLSTTVTVGASQMNRPSRVVTNRSSRPMVFVQVESHEMVDSETKNDIEWCANEKSAPTSTSTPSEKARFVSESASASVES